MKHLAFVTDGAIDIRSFTTFGINAKPNTKTAIGYFGTGLKYAVAVLCRLGGKVRVFIDGEEYEFYAAKSEFRDKTFNMVRMRRRRGFTSRWRYEALPFTTELGKNWEPWQVFRELESNTRDEGGTTFVVDDETDGEWSSVVQNGMKGQTVIIVSEPEVIEAYENRHQIFLPRETLHLRLTSIGVEIFNHPSRHLYYRGLRVADLEKPSAFTYNFTNHMELTEDRTLKYEFLARDRIMQAIAMSDDEDFLRQLLKTDPKNSFEGQLEFDSLYNAASPEFMALMARFRARGESVLPRALAYYDRYYVKEDLDPDVTVTMLRSEWDRIRDVLEHTDMYDLANLLGWEEEDERLSPLLRLRSLLADKVPEGVY